MSRPPRNIADRNGSLATADKTLIRGSFTVASPGSGAGVRAAADCFVRHGKRTIRCATIRLGWMRAIVLPPVPGGLPN